MSSPNYTPVSAVLQRLVRGALRAVAYPEHAVHRTALASVIAVVVVSNLLSFPVYWFLRPPGGLHSVPGFLVAALTLDGVLLAFVACSKALRGRFSADPSWSDLHRLPERLIAGLFAGPALFLVSALVQAVMMLAFDLRQTQVADFLWIRELPLPQFLIVLLVGAGVVPVAEEWFFRGYVFRAYLLARGSLWAYLASAVLFALLHLNLPAAPPILVMGLILAWLYHRSGSLLPGMIAHGFNNGAAFLLLYFAPLRAPLGV